MSNVDPSKLYTLVLVDPGTGPTFGTSFTVGFVHWTQVNIPGSQLASGVSGGALGGEALNPYFGPTNPQLASHMYTPMVYEQAGTMAPTAQQTNKYFNQQQRMNWPTGDFVREFGLGDARAAPWARTTFDSYTPYRIVETGIGALVGGEHCNLLPKPTTTTAASTTTSTTTAAATEPCVWGAYACPSNAHVGSTACLRSFLRVRSHLRRGKQLHLQEDRGV